MQIIEKLTPGEDAFAYARLSDTLGGDDHRGAAATGHVRAATSLFAPLPAPSAAMAPAAPGFLRDLAVALRERGDRIEVACLIIGRLMFALIAGRVALAWFRGAL